MYDDNSMAQMAINPRAGDERLYVEFKLHPLQDTELSDKENRPVYRDVEFVQMLTPGDRDVYFQPATEQDKRRFPKQYEAFRAGRAQEVIGTPLALLPGVTGSLLEEFAYFKIKTVEGLAELSDAVAVRLPGSQEWKRKARAFVQAAKENAPVAKVQAELEQRDAKIKALEQQLSELAAAVARKGK